MQTEERLYICSIVRLKCMQIEQGVYALGRVGIVEERIYMHYAGLGVGIKSLAAVNHRR